VRTRGSHRQFHHPQRPRTVTVVLVYRRQWSISARRAVVAGCRLELALWSGNAVLYNLQSKWMVPTAPLRGEAAGAPTRTSPSPPTNSSRWPERLKSMREFSPSFQTTDTASQPPATSGASGLFYGFPGSQFAGSRIVGATIGSCFITPPPAPGSGTPSLPKGLDAGSLSVTGPAGTFQLQSNPLAPGVYFTQLPNSAIPANGGAFTFNATGGKMLGPSVPRSTSPFRPSGPT
jgi:hypothetical protein